MNTIKSTATKIIATVILLLVTGNIFSLEITFDIKAYKSGKNISCHGASNGSIDASIIGGTAPYTYSWSNGATTEDITGLTAGSYTLTVTDANSNQESKVAVLYEPNTLTVNLLPSTYDGGFNISTIGGNDGNIGTEVGGGNSPYTYAWSNSATTALISGLTAGTYSVTVTDENGCTATDSKTMTQPPALHITSITAANHNGHNVSCFKGSDGSITLGVSGGVPPYNYEWSNGSFEQNPDKLVAGDYYVRVTDANEAMVTDSITLTEPNRYYVNLVPSTYIGYNISCNGCTDGTLTTTVGGGTSSYTYLWEGGQTTANRTALGVGGYAVTVTDANGCTTDARIRMEEPAAGGWTLNGNMGDTTNSIGTVNNAPLIFKTNNIERARISGSGDVTINNNATVNGTLTTGNLNISNELASNTIRTGRITEMPGDSVIHIGDSSIVFSGNAGRMYNDGVAVYKGIAIGRGTMGAGFYGGTLAKPKNSTAIGYNVRVETTGSVAICMGTGPTGGYLINPIPNSLMIGFNSNVPSLFVAPANGSANSTGNVGIGTTTPEDKFQIGYWSQKLVFGSATGANLGYGNAYIGFNASRQNLSTWSTSNDGGNNGGVILYNTTGGDLCFSTIPSTGGSDQTGISDATIKTNIRMLLKADGNIGIGTDLSNATYNPNFKLAVNGAIRAKRIVVETNWSDFVFEKNYKLMNLEDLEKYYESNKHLPGIPSEEEIKTNGGDLGELLKLQMQKIEELTLYIIEQNKRIESLDKKVNSLTK